MGSKDNHDKKVEEGVKKAMKRNERRPHGQVAAAGGALLRRETRGAPRLFVEIRARMPLADAFRDRAFSK